mgnify:CR=1 FL=1
MYYCMLISFISREGGRSMPLIGFALIVLDSSTNWAFAAIYIIYNQQAYLTWFIQTFSTDLHILFSILGILKEYVDLASNVTPAAIAGTLGACLILAVFVAVFLIR